MFDALTGQHCPAPVVATRLHLVVRCRRPAGSVWALHRVFVIAAARGGVPAAQVRPDAAARSPPGLFDRGDNLRREMWGFTDSVLCRLAGLADSSVYVLQHNYAGEVGWKSEHLRDCVSIGVVPQISFGSNPVPDHRVVPPASGCGSHLSVFRKNWTDFFKYHCTVGHMPI